MNRININLKKIQEYNIIKFGLFIDVEHYFKRKVLFKKKKSL